MLLALGNYVLPGSCTSRVGSFKTSQPNKQNPIYQKCCEKEASSHQSNWLNFLQISDGALLCLKSITWDLFGASEVPCHNSTKRVEYLSMLFPLHSHQRHCMRMSDGVAEREGSSLPCSAPCDLLEGGRAPGQIGGILNLCTIQTEPSVSFATTDLGCLWLSYSWDVALELCYGVSAILGSSISSARLTRAVRQHGVMKISGS